MTASNAAVDKKAANAAPEKAHEKLTEKRRALGRGLESLLPGPRVVTSPTTQTSASSQLQAPRSEALEPSVAGLVTDLRAEAQMPEGDHAVLLELDQIGQNPYQTRREFDPQALAELAASIQAQGVLQPIVVRPAPVGSARVQSAPVGAVSPEASPEISSEVSSQIQIGSQIKERYILILGERRFRASKIAGKTTIPAIVKRVSEQQAAEMTLVENVQRQDLNCVEQAEAFANLSKQFKMTQEDIGKRAGVSREQVSNYMRLLSLPDGVIGALQKGKLTYSHARTLLHLRNDVEIWTFAKRAMEEKLSVAKLEDLVLGVNPPPEPKTGGGARWVDPNVKAAQRSLEEVLGMRVRIQDRHGRGKIVVEYGTIDDFDRVVRMLKGK